MTGDPDTNIKVCDIPLGNKTDMWACLVNWF